MNNNKNNEVRSTGAKIIREIQKAEQIYNIPKDCLYKMDKQHYWGLFVVFQN